MVILSFTLLVKVDPKSYFPTFYTCFYVFLSAGDTRPEPWRVQTRPPLSLNKHTLIASASFPNPRYWLFNYFVILRLRLHLAYLYPHNMTIHGHGYRILVGCAYFAFIWLLNFFFLISFFTFNQCFKRLLRLTPWDSPQGKSMQISLEAIASVRVIGAYSHPAEAYSFEAITSRPLRPKPHISKGFSNFMGFWYIFYKWLKP